MLIHNVCSIIFKLLLSSCCKNHNFLIHLVSTSPYISNPKPNPQTCQQLFPNYFCLILTHSFSMTFQSSSSSKTSLPSTSPPSIQPIIHRLLRASKLLSYFPDCLPLAYPLL